LHVTPDTPAASPTKPRRNVRRGQRRNAIVNVARRCAGSDRNHADNDSRREQSRLSRTKIMELKDAQAVIKEVVDLICTEQCEFAPVVVSSTTGLRGSIVTKIVLFHSRFGLLTFNMVYFTVTFSLPEDERHQIIKKNCQEWMTLFLHDAYMWLWASGSEE
jgi:hypothetical protein